MQGSYYSTSSPILVILLFLIVAGPNGYEVVSSSFDLHFPDSWCCQTLFYVLIFSLEKHLFKPFSSSLNQVVVLMLSQSIHF